MFTIAYEKHIFVYYNEHCEKGMPTILPKYQCFLERTGERLGSARVLHHKREKPVNTALMGFKVEVPLITF